MFRKITLFLFLTVFMLSACTGTVATTQPASQSTPEPGLAPTGTPSAADRPDSPADGTMLCTMVSTRPTPGPTPASLFPPVSEADWIKGPADASITIVEYSDFQCPACAGLTPILDRLMEENPGNVRVVFRHFPLLSIHPNAALAAQAAEAAGRQAKFWEMHDLLFFSQDAWNSLSTPEFTAWLNEQALGLGLEAEQFTADLESDELQALVQQAWDWGVTTRIPHTPFLLIDGEIYSGPVSYSQLSNTIGLKLLEARQFDFCPEMTIDPTVEYFATVKTEKGDIVLRLFPADAPQAVNSFVFLARQGWFTGVTFHRVLPGFVAQAGDPSGSGLGGPGYAFAIEVQSGLRFDRAGLLAMANSGPESNGSQFFITTGAAPHLNGGYTIFGEVVEGLEVVQNLTPRNPQPGLVLPPGDLISEVTISER